MTDLTRKELVDRIAEEYLINSKDDFISKSHEQIKIDIIRFIEMKKAYDKVVGGSNGVMSKFIPGLENGSLFHCIDNKRNYIFFKKHGFILISRKDEEKFKHKLFNLINKVEMSAVEWGILND